jgi:lauroyl/myristoyl acyltransferase
MNILEEYVREHPEQWFWMHNIWKYWWIIEFLSFKQLFSAMPY